MGGWSSDMGGRRKARVLALKALYEADVAGHNASQVLERLITEEAAGGEAAEYARYLVRGVLAHRRRIDQVIRRKAPLFPLEHLSPVDRNILRIAIFEILVDNKVPVRAAINEAVELAKRYGNDSSPRFVNGVLGSVSLLATPR
jgi:N utilization substance protein B